MFNEEFKNDLLAINKNSQVYKEEILNEVDYNMEKNTQLLSSRDKNPYPNKLLSNSQIDSFVKDYIEKIKKLTGNELIKSLKLLVYKITSILNETKKFKTSAKGGEGKESGYSYKGPSIYRLLDYKHQILEKIADINSGKKFDPTFKPMEKKLDYYYKQNEEIENGDDDTFYEEKKKVNPKVKDKTLSSMEEDDVEEDDEEMEEDSIDEGRIVKRRTIGGKIKKIHKATGSSANKKRMQGKKNAMKGKAARIAALKRMWRGAKGAKLRKLIKKMKHGHKR